MSFVGRELGIRNVQCRSGQGAVGRSSGWFISAMKRILREHHESMAVRSACPLAVVRRLGYVLEDTKDKVRNLEGAAGLSGIGRSTSAAFTVLWLAQGPASGSARFPSWRQRS
jgi:hypothetical protein